MYQKHFGLSKNPFQYIAEGESIFEGPKQTKVIADLKTALAAKDSIAVITGPVGVGKTTIVQHALQQMSPNRFVATLGRTQVGPNELVDLLLVEFGVVREATTRVECLKAFERFLSEQARANIRVFIVIEDAERLGPELLEELEALTAGDGGAGANIILMGRQKLDNLIAKPSLEHLRQRIRLQQTLDRFTPEEVEKYLRERIAAADGDFNAMFEAGASLMVRRCSGGIPRVINSLCETALAMAADGNVAQVTIKNIFKVAVEVFGMSPGDQAASPTAKATPPIPLPVAAKKPAPVAARPEAANEQIADPTPPSAPASAPQQAIAPKAPKPPAKPAATAAGATASPAADPKVELPGLPKVPAPAAQNKAPAADVPAPKDAPKFRFADEIVVDRNTKTDLLVNSSRNVDVPEKIMPEIDEKPAVKNAPKPPVAAPAQTVAPEVKKNEPKAPATAPKPPAAPPAQSAPAAPAAPVAPAAPAPTAAPAAMAGSPEPKSEEPAASFVEVDHDMLDAALASLAVHDEEDKPVPVPPAPVADAPLESIPEVTLDKSIEAKLAQAKGVDSAEIGKMAAELEKTSTLEDMSDKLAETLFGNEELEAISMQIREEAAPAEESPVVLESPIEIEPADTAAKPTAEAAPAPQAASNPPTPAPPATNIDMGSDSAADSVPSPTNRGPRLEPIENQFASSMTATLKTLNTHKKPADDDDDSEERSGGLLGRLKDTFKS